ncbi:MAG TPA: TIGR02265 family protein [Longimicrobium sp.]|nr:TIGR02265 family protein [Longimicrobium sp.]
MQQIKGTILKSRLGFVEQHWGRDGVERVVGSLPDEDQKALRTLLSVKWYPFALGERLDAAIVQVLGNGHHEVFERLGAASADANLGTVHRQFLAPGKPHVFLGKAPMIYGLYYETGRRTYEQTGERSGVMTTYEAETFSVPDCLTVAGWYRRALELCGVEGVSITEDECRARGGEVCRYRIEWKGAPAA